MLSNLTLIAAVLGAATVAAQPIDQKAARDALNWDIFQKLYPKRAIEAREEGAVGFTVTLDNKGEVVNCAVTHSSGHPLLDQETCKIITLNAVFKSDPNLAPSQTKTHEGMIAWKLPNGSAQLAAPKPVASAELDKMICKKSVKTGSLASTERTCMTLRDWNKMSDDAKEMWQDIQGKKGSTHGN
ncbi:MAG: TonB family protein [Sphingomonas sp.]|nr:TonB family protein [Sphingomonas sp.]